MNLKKKFLKVVGAVERGEVILLPPLLGWGGGGGA